MDDINWPKVNFNKQEGQRKHHPKMNIKFYGCILPMGLWLKQFDEIVKTLEKLINLSLHLPLSFIYTESQSLKLGQEALKIQVKEKIWSKAKQA